MTAPTTLAAERVVLGALLRAEAVSDQVRTVLTADAFADPVHAAIFRRITAYGDRGRDAGLLVIDAEAGEDPVVARELADVGGASYLRDLADTHPDNPGVAGEAQHVMWAATAVYDGWAARTLIGLAEDMRRFSAETLDTAFQSDPHDGSTRDNVRLVQLRLTGWKATVDGLVAGFGA